MTWAAMLGYRRLRAGRVSAQLDQYVASAIPLQSRSPALSERQPSLGQASRRQSWDVQQRAQSPCCDAVKFAAVRATIAGGTWRSKWLIHGTEQK